MMLSVDLSDEEFVLLTNLHDLLNAPFLEETTWGVVKVSDMDEALCKVLNKIKEQQHD